MKQGRGNTLGSGREDEAARHQAARIPTTLNRLRLVAVAVCLVFGALTALQLMLSWQANRTAADDTQQLVRVQGIKTSLLRADALATNAFLIGGLEPAEQRAAYDDAIHQTVRSITDAAQAQPADRAALNALSSAVLDYAGDMDLARSNNRQGLPIGGAYLRKASAELRSTALPIVDQLVLSNSDRARDSMGAHHPWYVLLPALVVIAVLYLVNRWIGRTFRRRFNTGLRAGGRRRRRGRAGRGVRHQRPAEPERPAHRRVLRDGRRRSHRADRRERREGQREPAADRPGLGVGVRGRLDGRRGGGRQRAAGGQPVRDAGFLGDVQVAAPGDRRPRHQRAVGRGGGVGDEHRTRLLVGDVRRLRRPDRGGGDRSPARSRPTPSATATRCCSRWRSWRCSPAWPAPRSRPSASTSA